MQQSTVGAELSMTIDLLKRTPLARRVALTRLLLLLLVPLTIWVTMQDTVVAPGAVGLQFARPVTWTYLTGTRVAAVDTAIRYDADALAAALTEGKASPLFAILKYPHPHAGVNPMIGVNVSLVSGTETPQQELSRRVDEVQRNSGDALEVLQPITPTTIGGYAAARVVLHATKTASAGPAPDKMTVVAIVADKLSLMIAASGAFDGEDAVESTLEEFLASFALVTP